MTHKTVVTHFHFDQIDSTNSLARRWLNSSRISLPSPTIITADFQTKGRGTKGRTWISDDDGGLYFSAIFPDKAHIDNDVTLIAQVIQRCVFTLAGVQLEIEWPNDLIFNGKKIAGILLERVGPSIIVGIGLNINQSQFPKSLTSVATSLTQITGRQFSKTAFSLELSKELCHEMSRH